MTEYVSKETLLKAVEKIDRLDKETNTQYEYDKQGYILLIKNAPPADVAEVVRCKDCEYCYDAVMGGMWCEHPDNIMPLGSNPEDFCSYGKKKEKRYGLQRNE